jgi:hypothetical protein
LVTEKSIVDRALKFEYFRWKHRGEVSGRYSWLAGYSSEYFGEAHVEYKQRLSRELIKAIWIKETSWK